MQRFPCPFCGLRDEREFQYYGEAGNVRPDTTGTVGDRELADYLYVNQNPIGETREIWVHLPCREFFVMQRDTKTMAVLGTEQLRKDTP